jgi:hypothetical protein
MNMLAFTHFVSTIGYALCQPTTGPFAVESKLYDVPILDETNRQAWVWYPVTNNTNLKFPYLVYLHGFLGGNQDIAGYSAMFQQLSSYGFVLAATLSCNVGCTDPSQGAPWSNCQGILPLQPPGQGWGPYYAEGLKLIDWGQNMTNLGEDPIFAMINWTTGVGITGC